VSFWIDEVMYDKRFVFLPETIVPEKMKTIPVLGQKGIIML
jgi:hypothetical protein